MSLARNALSYAMAKGPIIYGAPGFKQAMGELRYTTDLRRDLKDSVLHFMLALHPGDREMTDDEIASIAIDGLTHLGYGECPMTVIRHHDKEYQHVHILTTRTGLDGKRVERGQEIERAAKWERQAEVEHGLHRVIPDDPKHPLRKGGSVVYPPLGTPSQDTPLEPVGVQGLGRQLLEFGLRGHHTLRDLLSYLENAECKIEPTLQKNGKLKTLLMQVPGDDGWRPLSYFGDFSIAKLQKKHGLQELDEIDYAALLQRVTPPSEVPLPKPIQVTPPRVDLAPPRVLLVPEMKPLVPSPAKLVGNNLPKYFPQPQFSHEVKNGLRTPRHEQKRRLFPDRFLDWCRRLVPGPWRRDLPSPGKHNIG